VELITLSIPPPGFDLETERVKRRAHVLACELALSDATAKLKAFQGEHYSVGPDGALVPRISMDVVNNFDVAQQRHRLLRSMGGAHDKFQAALKSFAEISE
jgi:hypothetical protein